MIVLLKRKRLIAGITFVTALIAAIISFMMTPVYVAETRILQPRQSNSMVAAQILSSGGAMRMEGPVNDHYAGVLESRTIVDRIIERFKLKGIYEVRSLQGARKALLSALDIRHNIKTGVITIAVKGNDPKRAADMADAFVEELINLTKGLAVTEASQRRLFFEEQLKEVKISLLKAEDEVKSFHMRTGAIQVDTQAKAVIGNIASLRAQIAAKEVQLKVMRSYATPQNPDLQSVENELIGLKAELSKLEAKSGDSAHGVMSAGAMSSASAENMRVLRGLKFNETLYELLTKQYEAAKLDEAGDVAVIQVIDRAETPERSISPKRLQIVTIAALAGFLVSALLAFYLDYVERSLSDPKSIERFEVLRKYVFRWKG